MVSPTHAALAVATGFLTGAVFRYIGVPIPAPPNISGVLGIVGIYLGYSVLEYFDVGLELLSKI